jgi:hypothetical protein
VEPGKMLLIAGALLNSALYLTGCFVAGLVVGNPIAWKLSLVAAGLVFLAYSLMATGHPRLSAASDYVGAASWVVGIAAGGFLLWTA